MDTCIIREEDILALLTLVSTDKNSTVSNFSSWMLLPLRIRSYWPCYVQDIMMYLL